MFGLDAKSYLFTLRPIRIKRVFGVMTSVVMVQQVGRVMCDFADSISPTWSCHRHGAVSMILL